MVHIIHILTLIINTQSNFQTRLVIITVIPLLVQQHMPFFALLSRRQVALYLKRSTKSKQVDGYNNRSLSSQSFYWKINSFIQTPFPLGLSLQSPSWEVMLNQTFSKLLLALAALSCGLGTNSIPSCQLPTIMDHCKKVRFCNAVASVVLRDFSETSTSKAAHLTVFSHL